MGMKTLISFRQITPTDTSHPSTNAVTKRYGPPVDPKDANANVLKLWAFVRLFGLTPVEVAKAVGVSRSYVARVLSENDAFVGGPEFYRRLEGKLGHMVEGRSSQFFAVDAVPAPGVEDVGRGSGQLSEDGMISVS